MKLNNKRTILIGFAFLSICAFWQLYDTVIPLILRDTFLMGDARADGFRTNAIRGSASECRSSSAARSRR